MLPSASSPVQPVFVLGMLVVDAGRLPNFTRDLLYLKQRYHPGGVARPDPRPRFLDRILFEIKDADLRKQTCEASRRRRRFAYRFMDEVVSLLEMHEVRLLARVWVKAPEKEFAGRAIYTSSMQALCASFQQYLCERNEDGIVVADARLPQGNTQVAHSIFTQKFRAGGDAYDRLAEMPVFGHSLNHAGLQAVDLVTSAFIVPMAITTYCEGHLTSLHIRPGYAELKARFASRISHLQYRYCDRAGRWRGGVTVCDAIASRSAALMFRVP
ncbi:MAG: DUF3800 domain-containing protein [Candidatus Sumerlaeia bacterium]|nr:DUF3800 domain-containing protein [Candidatus Sumerlaeia bacterium]